MLVKSLEEIIGSDQVTSTDNWSSRRLLLSNDNMGFSLHDTVIRSGTETHIWYKNHLEAVYCIEGNGEIETVADGKVYPIKAGTIYALDQHDEHYLRGGSEDMRMVCVFNPPLTGNETHDKDGAYPLLQEQGNLS